ncbi:MAG: hypothetical protein ACTSUN_00705, partial [Promethearchaeota archaeon]
KNPNPKEIDYTRHWRLDSCPKCNGSLKNSNPIDHHDHQVRDLEKLKRGICLVYTKHVIYHYKCPHCKCLVSKYFGKLKNARHGIGMIAFVLYERKILVFIRITEFQPIPPQKEAGKNFSVSDRKTLRRARNYLKRVSSIEDIGIMGPFSEQLALQLELTLQGKKLGD